MRKFLMVLAVVGLLMPIVPSRGDSTTCGKCGASKRSGSACPGCGDEG